MNRIVFLLEERSMKILLEGLLPRLVPGIQFICVPHEGKQDLEKSIPRKLRAWKEPGVRFVVVRDNDGGDCYDLKKKLMALCVESARPDALVRLACQEPEAWYFGESSALAAAFDKARLNGIEKKARYKDPDAIQKPSRELSRLDSSQNFRKCPVRAEWRDISTAMGISHAVFKYSWMRSNVSLQ